MKIGYYVCQWPPIHAGGILTYLSQLTTALTAQGHEIYFITHDPTDTAKNIVNIKDFSSKPSLFKQFFNKYFTINPWIELEGSTIAKAFAWAVDQYHLDIIEIEDSFGWAFDVTSAVTVPVVIRLHGPWKNLRPFSKTIPPSKQDAARIKREEKAFRNAMAISSPTEFALKSIGPTNAPKKLCRVFPHGTALPEKSWNANSACPYSILFVGRFDNVKGADLAIDAFALLSNTYKDSELHLVGRDTGLKLGSSTLHFDEFIDLRGLQSIKHRIHYYKELDREAVNRLRLNSKITINPSRAETFCYTVLEAMSFGCPIIALDIDGMPELIEQNKTGILVQSESPSALASKIQFLFDHPQEAEQMGRNARHVIAERFNIKHFIEDATNFYNDVIAYYKGLS